MNIIRYEAPAVRTNPFARFSTVADEMGRLVDFPFFGRMNRFAPTGWVPAFDLYEDPDKLTVRAELPGLKKDQIKLTLKDDVLTVSGERKQEADTQNGEHIRRERVFGGFERAIALPFPVNQSTIAAGFEDGVLTITLPKAEEAKPRQIAIN
jgi:HSP20 family protein